MAGSWALGGREEALQPALGVVAIWCAVDLAEGLLERSRLGCHGIAHEQCAELPPPWQSFLAIEQAVAAA